MPELVDRLPKLNRNSLRNRALRAEGVRLTVALTEPAQVCLQLRQQRIMFHKRMIEVDQQPVSIESNADLCRLQAAYASVSNLLLRLAKVPQAPSGASNKADEQRPQLDITPEALPIDTPEAANPGGSLEPDSPI